jgi:hypothetical protein
LGLAASILPQRIRLPSGHRSPYSRAHIFGDAEVAAAKGKGWSVPGVVAWALERR